MADSRDTPSTGPDERGVGERGVNAHGVHEQGSDEHDAVASNSLDRQEDAAPATHALPIVTGKAASPASHDDVATGTAAEHESHASSRPSADRDHDAPSLTAATDTSTDAATADAATADAPATDAPAADAATAQAPAADAKPVDDIVPIGGGDSTKDAQDAGRTKDLGHTVSADAGNPRAGASVATAPATSAASDTDTAAAVGATATTPTPATGARASATTPSADTGSAPAPMTSRGPHPQTAENAALDRDAARRAAVRDGVIHARPPFPRFLQVVVALFFPIIVLAAAVRAVATSSFLWIEYNRPGFPADQFGFSLEDRMTYGSYALDYVLNFAPPRYLGELTTPGGTPLFLESEVGHMADVKGVLGVAFAVALVMFVLTVLACVYLSRRYKGGIRRALFAGAVITLVGIAALAVLAITAWEAFFTQVHALFFSEGTWTFRVDDTLIRLFPEQFWTDSAVVVGVLVVLATLLTLVLTWPTKARRERSKRAQEALQVRYLESLRAS